MDFFNKTLIKIDLSRLKFYGIIAVKNLEVEN